MSRASKPKIRQNRRKQGLNLTLEKLSADFRVDKIIEVMVQQIVDHVPECGDFSPVLEFFVNPDPRTSEFVGKYGLRVYKMPNDIVADPRIRYVEAAAYIPSGLYKSDCTVVWGTKDEIIATMLTAEFAEKLHETFLKLGELFEHYD